VDRQAVAGIDNAPERHAKRIASTFECNAEFRKHVLDVTPTVRTLIDSASETPLALCARRRSASRTLAAGERVDASSVVCIEPRHAHEINQRGEVGRGKDQLSGRGSPEQVRYRALVGRPGHDPRRARGDHRGADLGSSSADREDPDTSERHCRVAQDVDRRARQLDREHVHGHFSGRDLGLGDIRTGPSTDTPV
jgi:hypothetical protein